MAGTIHGRINCRFNTGYQRRDCQEQFTTIFKFLNAHTTLETVQYGLTSQIYAGSGLGTGYWDEDASFGDNAFAVFKFPAYGSRTWYWQLLIQFSENAFGLAPGNPGLLNGYGGGGYNSVGIQAAIGLTGGGAEADPWNAVKKLDGTAAKGAQVWNVAGGTTHVWPRSNNAGGSHNANRENCAKITSRSGSSPFIQNMNMFVDRDSFAMVFSDNDTSYFSHFVYVGPYKVLGGLPITTPLVMHHIYYGSNWSFGGQALGDLTGTGNNQGGVLTRTGGVRVGVDDVFSNSMSSAHHPRYRGPNQVPDWAEMPLMILGNEAGHYGLLGEIDSPLIRVVQVGANYRRNQTKTRIKFGGFSDGNARKFTMPWDGSSTGWTQATGRTGTDWP